MPELPEVETTRRGLLMHTKGASITKTTVRRGDLRLPVPSNLAKQVTGRVIADIERRSKYLLFRLEAPKKTPIMMLVHLGMSGSVRLEPPKFVLKKHDHILWKLSTGEVMVFHDPRRFGIVTLISEDEMHSHSLLAHLGPEPFSKEFSAAYVKKALARRHSAIKPVLMDAGFVVGVGNIYASESLHRCGIHVDMPASQIGKKAGDLVKAVRETLQAAIDSGGSTLRDYVQSKGETGYFQHTFRVYGRGGEPCMTCGTIISHGVRGSRATYWCTTCQQNHS